MIITINVVDDTFIRQNSASTNFDGESYMALGKTGSSSQVDRILMGFNFSSIAGKVINSATLYLQQVYSSYAYSAELPFTAHCISASFSASSATWNNQPAYTANGATELILSGNATGQRSFNITGLIKDIIENSRTCYGILLKQTNESLSSLRKQFYTEERTAPYIVVDYSDPVEETITGYIAIAQGSINKTIKSIYIAPEQGSINKQVTSVYLAATQGAINKTVL